MTRQEGDERETRGRQEGDKRETRGRQEGGERETRGRQDGDKRETRGETRGRREGGERETYGKQQSSTWTSQRCQPIFWNTLRGMTSGCKTDVFQHENQFHRAGLQAVRPTYSNMKIKSTGFRGRPSQNGGFHRNIVWRCLAERLWSFDGDRKSSTRPVAQKYPALQ